MRRTAVNLTRHLKQKDYDGEIRCINEFCRDQIRYVRDISGVETLHSPDALLVLGCGDCDDKAILNASLLLALGHTVRYVALSQGNGFCHVWTQALSRAKRGWINLEPTEPYATGRHVPINPARDRLIFQVI